MSTDRVYTCPIPSANVGTAVQDIVAMIATTTKSIRFHHLWIGANVTAQGVARLRFKRGSATVTAGTGGAAGAPIPVDPADGAVAVAVRLGDTAQATTSGAFSSMAEVYWDTSLPFELLPVPEDREFSALSGALILDLPAVLGAAVTVAGFVKFAEVP